MGTGEPLYYFVLVMHLLGVIAGIGTVFLNGVYNAQARAIGGVGGTAVSVANERVSKIAEGAIYSIPFTGLVLLWLSDGAYEIGQTWAWLSLVLYVVAIGISHAVLIPGHRRYNELAHTEGGPSVGAEAKGIEKKMAGAGATLNLLTVVIVVLMVWKPGL